MSEIKIYTWESEVKDNEVDIQGVVHHANYIIYMAHARHKHLKAIGIDFNEMHNVGYNLVLTHSEVCYKDSLRSEDEFIVTSKLQSNGKIRFTFVQDIVRKRDSKIVTSALNTGTCLSIATGRPFIPDKLRKVMDELTDCSI